MDPYEIEDTDDWLGSPTPLETCRHSLHIYENEIQELTLQLRQAREKIYKLVEMHADVAQERDGLRSELQKNRAALDDVSRRAAELETKTNWELMAKARHLGSGELAAGQHFDADDSAPRNAAPCISTNPARRIGSHVTDRYRSPPNGGTCDT